MSALLALILVTAFGGLIAYIVLRSFVSLYRNRLWIGVIFILGLAALTELLSKAYLQGAFA